MTCIAHKDDWRTGWKRNVRNGASSILIDAVSKSKTDP